MKVFLVAPQQAGDGATGITVQWGAQLKEALTGLEQFDVISFLGEDAVRAKILAALEKERGKEGIFIYIDHGKDDYLLDSNDYKLIDDGNVGILKNKLVYTIACLSVNKLGKRALEEGAAGYIGFKDEFYLYHEESDIFGLCFLTGIMAILKEHQTLFQAQEKMIDIVNRTIDQFKMDKKIYRPLRDAIITSLRHNIESLVFLGNLDWKIS